MKYKLETIPVWDALNENCECPFCILMEKAEARYIKYYLGNSAMNPETRVEVNKTGFCPQHFSGLLLARSPQHLGLIAHTHLQHWMDDLDKKYPSRRKSLLERLSRKGPTQSEAFSDHIDNRTKSCLICDRIERTLKRYTFTSVYLWKNDEEGFRSGLESSKGFCIPHAKELLLMGEEILNQQEFSEFATAIENLQKKNFERLEEEINWFTQKFKSENHDKPWGSAEDAHYRLIQKLTGKITAH
ncbi:MAG: hypothetical protein B6241_02700 [Spirochaetaceae bacterium 4572_59]|nr:MAG: hypothetical protein B6241_02700 [Spirochaetaceae bacterium 4572_59]